MTAKTIIIDDHHLFNDGLALILKEGKDFNIVGQVYDSRQALHQCQLKCPDLVLVDFNMPHLDGLEVVKQLNTLGDKHKVVIISMYADSKEIQLFKELGVHGYLPKTTPAKELRETLREVMAGKLVFKSVKADKEAVEKDNFILKYRISKREIEILKALKAGNNTDQIAVLLNLSYFTVETHRKNINHKLNFKSKQEFYAFLQEFNP